MKIVSLLINEDVARAERAFERATSDNIVELCRDYLKVLSDYRHHLMNLRAIPEINFAERSSLARELTEQSRRAVRAAIEMTETAHRLVEALLDSFTSINSWEAAETFNALSYKGSSRWASNGGDVFVRDSPAGEKMDSRAASEVAGRLRREEYVTHRTTFFEKQSAASDHT